MAPIEPLLPGDLAQDASAHHHHHHHHHGAQAPATPSHSRRRSQSGTAGSMLAPPMQGLSLSRSSSTGSLQSAARGSIREKLGLGGVARRTLGIGLLLVVVFLWPVSNFLASVSCRLEHWGERTEAGDG
jgi:solute carrier family 35 protein F5